MQLDAEVESLVPGRSFDRRGFMKTALGSAFAAAVLPVSAQTVHTDFNGLTAGEVTVPVGDFKMPAYRAHCTLVAHTVRPPYPLSPARQDEAPLQIRTRHEAHGS